MIKWSFIDDSLMPCRANQCQNLDKIVSSHGQLVCWCLQIKLLWNNDVCIAQECRKNSLIFRENFQEFKIPDL